MRIEAKARDFPTEKGMGVGPNGRFSFLFLSSTNCLIVFIYVDMGEIYVHHNLPWPDKMDKGECTHRIQKRTFVEMRGCLVVRICFFL